jgi:hypothetical protein
MKKLDNISKKRDTVGMMNPWCFVLQDEQNIPDNKEQAFGRVLDTYFKTENVPYVVRKDGKLEVVYRIFCDSLSNLFMAACCVDNEGGIIGHATRIPLKMTSHDDYLRSGAYIDVTTRKISDASRRELEAGLLDSLFWDFINKQL